jgi:hypothetical protein
MHQVLKIGIEYLLMLSHKIRYYDHHNLQYFKYSFALVASHNFNFQKISSILLFVKVIDLQQEIIKLLKVSSFQGSLFKALQCSFPNIGLQKENFGKELL